MLSCAVVESQIWDLHTLLTMAGQDQVADLAQAPAEGNADDDQVAGLAQAPANGLVERQSYHERYISFSFRAYVHV